METEPKKPFLSERQKLVLAGILMLGAVATMYFSGGSRENPGVLPLVASVYLFSFGAALFA